MSQVVSADFGVMNIRVAYFPSPNPSPSTQSKSPTEAGKGPDHVMQPAYAKDLEIFPASLGDDAGLIGRWF